jgi:hypothetical protein
MILDIINELASIGSTKEKEAIIRRHKDNELLKRVFRMTYDGKLQYYIKKWPEAGERTHGTHRTEQGRHHGQWQSSHRRICESTHHRFHLCYTLW